MGTPTALDLDALMRIPPLSPSRRDYGIRTPPRSPSPVHYDSRPESPWLAAEQALSPASRAAETFRRYESQEPPLLMLDRGAYYSGPLPAAPERSSLPSFSGPLPGLAPPVDDSFEFATWARIYHQHVNDGASLPGSVSSRHSSFRKEGDDCNVATTTMTTLDVLAPSPPPQFSARAGMHGRVGSVSGELGRSDEVEKQQKSLVTRGYKSGEIDVAAAFWFDIVRQQRWDSLNKGTSPSCDAEPMVTIPFRWDEASPRSRASSKSDAQNEAGIGGFSFGSGEMKPGSEKTESMHGSEASGSVSSKVVVKPAPATSAKKSSVSAKKATSVVPFKWEDSPGKPKPEESNQGMNSTEKTPALQLPPRLATASAKRTSWSTSTPSSTFRSRSIRSSASQTPAKTRPVKTQSQIAPDSSKSKYSRQSQTKSAREAPPLPAVQPCPQSLPPSSQPASSPRPSSSSQTPSSPQPLSLSPDVAQPRHSLGPNFLSGPLDAAAKPPTSVSSKSGPISQLGFPQCDFFPILSPTSTLQGPSSISSDGHSHTSENCSRKSPSVTYSHSGTSAESLEHWSDQDPAFDSFDSTTTSSISSSTPASETAMRKLRRRLPKSKSSSKSKPPMSPISPSPSSAASDFDKAPAAAEDFPPTRLPYKMPVETNPYQETVVSEPEPGFLFTRRWRAGANSKWCFELPRFMRSRSSGQQVAPAFAAPLRAPEAGYRSPTYKATLEMLSPSPSPSPMSSTSKALGPSSSPRHFVEGFCKSVKHSLHSVSKRNGGKTNPTANDDPFMKRRSSLAL